MLPMKRLNFKRYFILVMLSIYINDGISDSNLFPKPIKAIYSTLTELYSAYITRYSDDNVHNRGIP